MGLKAPKGPMAEPLAVPLAVEGAASEAESEAEEAEQQEPKAQEGEAKGMCCLCRKAPPRCRARWRLGPSRADLVGLGHLQVIPPAPGGSVTPRHAEVACPGWMISRALSRKTEMPPMGGPT